MQFVLVVSCILTITVSILTAFVLGQNDGGPTPPRLNIPGAIPIPIRSQLRNEKFNSNNNNNNQVIRVRRPISRPQPINSLPVAVTPKLLLDDSKPVTEEPEDNINSDPFIPQIIAQQQPQQQQSQQSSYYQEPNSIQQDSPIDDLPPQQIPRFQPQERPIPQRLPELIGSQRFAIPTERQERPKPLIRSRPSSVIAHRESRPQPQYDTQEHNQQQFNRQQIAERRVQAPRPTPQVINNVHNNEVRTRKPVAQILRKWTEEHEDGSITWGFENDDGSFKEETIGIDCVTRGRYGYVDPDGLKREYNYETGIQCDPNKRDQDAELEQTGFVDYEGNKAVLPNGVEIDLANMGKKKSKRPGAVLQQPQQQYYRN